MALGGILLHTVSARILVEKGGPVMRLGVLTWPGEPTHTHPSVFFTHYPTLSSSEDKAEPQTFSFLSFSAMLRIYQGFMYVRQVLYGTTCLAHVRLVVLVKT